MKDVAAIVHMQVRRKIHGPDGVGSSGGVAWATSTALSIPSFTNHATAAVGE